MNRHFPKEHIQMASKNVKRYSALLVSRKLEIKTIKMAVIKETDNKKYQ